jgi:hypothetical protein
VQILQPTTFTGLFPGFQEGDAIDLSGLDATSVSYSGGVPPLDSGSTLSGQLAVLTSYTNNVFDLAPTMTAAPWSRAHRGRRHRRHDLAQLQQ